MIPELKTNQSMTRLFSLRHDFPDVFHRLSTSELGAEIGFTIESKHFPFFLMGRVLKTGAAKLRVLSPLGDLAGATLTIREKDLVPPLEVRTSVALALLTPEVTGRGIREFDLGSVQKDNQYSGITSALTGDYVIQLTAAGTDAIDPDQLYDIVLEIRYGLK